MNVKVVLLPDGQDPDDFARRHTLAQVQDHIAQNEQDFINFKTELLLGEAGNDPLKRANLINDIADTIALMPDAVVRAVYVRATAERFDMDEQILADRIVKTRSKVLLEESVDDSLIGGFVLQVEDLRMDASVQTQLRRLHNELVDKANRIV